MKYQDYQIRGQSELKARTLFIFDLVTSKLIKDKKIKINPPKKILIIRNDHIGDLAECNQVFREIKRIYPQCKLTAMVSKSARQIIEKNPHVDEIIEIGLFWREKSLESWKKYFKIFKKIKQEKFDYGIDIRASLPNILFFLWLPKIKNRASYWNISGGKAFLTHKIKYQKNEHTIFFDLKLVEKTLEIKFKDYWPEIYIDKQDKENSKKIIKEKKLTDYICIIPGATNELKKWPKEKFNELIKKINKEYPKKRILLVGGNDEKKIIKDLEKNKNCTSLINKNLRVLPQIFKKSKLVITNDGGPMHIAWISGAKVLALWGPTNLDLDIIHHKKKCYPCLQKCKEKNKCINQITLEEVFNKVKKILN